MDFRGCGEQNGVPLRTNVFRRRIMGLAMSVPQLLIILVNDALIFGTKRGKASAAIWAARALEKAILPE
jgi:hypothetical protein